MMELPLGFKFNPTDEDVVSFLTDKHSGQHIAHPGLIAERHIYAPDASWDFDTDFATVDDGDPLHFYTPLLNNQNDEDRVVANGTWRFQRAYNINDGSSQIIGRKKLFTFFDNDSQNRGWIMHEFTLPDQQVWAICRVKQFRNRATSSSITIIPSAATLRRKKH